MTRHGMDVGLQPDKVDQCRRLHAAVWPDVLAMIERCNIRNYSIFLRQFDDGRYHRFSYFEYCGDDFDADMAKMAADPTTQQWWRHCIPCQSPLETRVNGEWWASMEDVFHTD